MRKWITLVLLLLVGAEVFAQGSAPSPPQLWRRRGTADTSFIVIKTGDTVMLYDTAHYVKMSIRGSDEAWLIPDSMVGTTMVLTDRIIAPSIQVGRDGGGGSLQFDNFASTDYFYSLIGNGLENVSGYLTVTIGASVEGSEVTNQTLTKSDIDTTATFPFGALYHKTTAVSDSAYQSKYYIDHNLFGYSVTGTPTGGQVPVYNSGSGQWSFGSGGGGSGDDIAFDMTLGSGDYTLGSTTYTGGYINTSTVWMRGDTGLNILKSGQHPGDTMLFTPDWTRVMRNNGTQYIYNFRSAAEDTMGTVYDSAAYTIWRTGGTTSGGAGNSGGLKMNNVLNLNNNIRFWGNGKRIDSLSGIRAYSNYLFINSDSGIYINGSYVGGTANVPVYFGSSNNYTQRADTLRGTGSSSKIFDIGRVTSDTVQPTVVKYYANGNILKQVADTDVVKVTVRDTTNNITTDSVPGTYRLRADDGLTELDSAVHHGRIRMYDGTNKSRIDSASGISADTLKTLPGGFLTLQGATSGRTRIKGNASAITSYDLVLPAAQGAANQALINDGSGNFSWGSAGTGNGSADFDTTASLDSNILKGSSGTILLDVHKNSTPSVVIGKGATMTSLIIGGNSSGLMSVDTAALIYKTAYWGATVNKQTAIDSTFVYEQLKKLRYYFKSTDLYWSPEKSNAADKRFLTWNLCDTASTWPNNSHLAYLYDLVDSTGDSKRPLNHTWFATERDSLFSLVWNYRTDSAAFTGSTDTSKIGYPEYAILWKNGTQIDSVFIGKGKAALATDSINFTDVPIAAGDVITTEIWFNSKGGTSAKRLRVAWAYLNMRRY